jgi:SAM-dependent methyltransferase
MERLKRAAHIELTLRSDGHVVVHRGDRKIAYGPWALPILHRFSQPALVTEVLDGLAVRGAAEYMAASSTIVGMVREGILGSEEMVGDDGFDDPGQHLMMLSDETRTASFLRAIASVVRADDVVLEIGTGTGFLSVAAARAGAKRVYAIERGTIATYAERVFAANGVDVKLLRGDSSAVDLPERADVLITETIGSDPFVEGILGLVHDARARFLAPGARIIPAKVRLGVLPVKLEPEVVERYRFTPELLARWKRDYGVDFGPLAEHPAQRTRFEEHMDVTRSWELAGAERIVFEVDLRGEIPRAFDVTVELEPADAALFYFEAELAPGLVISTHPRATPVMDSWRNVVHLGRVSRVTHAMGRTTVHSSTQ